MSAVGGPVFLFDGDCAFCTRCADLIEKRIPTQARVVPWQWVDLAPLGVSQKDAEAAVQWIGSDGTVAAGPEAIVALLRDAGSFWAPLGWLMARPPLRWAMWPLYRVVSRNRHRLPGGTAACALPQAEREKSNTDATVSGE